MWEWCDNLRLGKSSAFVKRDIRSLPMTDAEVEADFFHDPIYSTKRHERWVGLVVEREGGALLAIEDVRLPPPTVNNLADLLAHAMLRPFNDGKRLRPGIIYLRDRPQWQELLPHLEQLEIKVVLGQGLPRFDEAAVEWIQYKTKQPPPTDEIKTALRKPFPTRKRSSFTDAMALMEWSHTMFKGAYPSRQNPTPLYAPETIVSLRLSADELEAILTQTRISKTKQFRPRLEAMAAKGEAIELDINDWSSVVSALCGPTVDVAAVRKQMLKMATRIAEQLAEALNIEPPKFLLK